MVNTPESQKPVRHSRIDVLLKNYIQSHKKISSAKSNNTVYNFWTVTDIDIVKNIMYFFSNLNSFFLTDGHHRVSAYKKYMPEEKIMALLYSKNSLNVFPMHKLFFINDYSSKESIESAFHNHFEFDVVKNTISLNRNQTILTFNNRACLLTLKKEFSSLLNKKKLISEIVHDLLLNNRLVHANKIQAIPGPINLNEFFSKVCLENQVGFFFPELLLTDILQLKQLLHPNTTYFEPKIPEGLISFSIQDKSKKNGNYSAP